jgi:hypothetical protein
MTIATPTSVQDVPLKTIEALGRRIVEERSEHRESIKAAIARADAAGHDFCEVREAFAAVGITMYDLMVALELVALDDQRI